MAGAGCGLLWPQRESQPPSASFHGNSQLADAVRAVTHPELLGSSATKGKIKVRIFLGKSC